MAKVAGQHALKRVERVGLRLVCHSAGRGSLTLSESASSRHSVLQMKRSSALKRAGLAGLVCDSSAPQPENGVTVQ